jgi:hypothetical protein
MFSSLEVHSDVETLNINFTIPNYSEGKKFFWKHGIENAKTIFYQSQYHSNVFELLQSSLLGERLNLHKTAYNLEDQSEAYENLSDDFFVDTPFYESSLSQEEYFKTLDISNWVYTDFVSSVAYFVFLENYKTIQQSKYLSNTIKLFMYYITPLILNFQLGNTISNMVNQMNLIQYDPKLSAKAFQNFID